MKSALRHRQIIHHSSFIIFASYFPLFTWAYAFWLAGPTLRVFPGTTKVPPVLVKQGGWHFRWNNQMVS